jgi:quercetin dioxygenase-like cupin family protein
MTRRRLLAAIVAGLLLTVACSTAAHVHATNSTVSGVTIQKLAQGQLNNLPAAKVYVNILEFRQLPGAAFGPHGHVPVFVYTLHGIATISSTSAPTRSVGPGDAAFIPALVPAITQNNVDGRIVAGAIAVGLIVVVILLCVATWLRGGLRRVIIAVLSVSLIAGGALVLTGATSNDYYFIAVRSESERSRPMPVPYGRVTFSSPDVNPVPAAPYVETLSTISVPPGARYDARDVPGPEMIIVVTGSASVEVGDQTQQLAGGGAAFTQARGTVAIVNRGSDTLHVLDFAVTPPSPTLAPT